MNISFVLYLSLFNGWLRATALTWAILVIGLLSVERALAEEQACKDPVAQLVAAQGQVAIKRAGQDQWQTVQTDQTDQTEQVLCVGDSVRTGPRSRATVQASAAETTASLDENTVLTITVTAAEQSFWIKLLEGAVYFFSRTPQTLNVETPYANAAVEGTEFLVRVEAGQTSVLVFEGLVKTSNPAGSFMAGDGEAVLAKAGQAPRRLLVSNPQEAVQWALYYPPIIAYPARELQGSDPAVAQALERFQANDLPAAFARLDGVSQARRDLRYWDVRASLLLSVGRVEEARAAIDHVLSLDRTDGSAMALQAIIAVTQNKREQGLQLAQQAVKQAPQAAAPRIALSYARQSVFELDAARQNAAEATRLEPDNALAWARLAELQLMQGNPRSALASAQQAVALNPRLGQTQTVLGFAYLTRFEIAAARARFDEAIRLGPAAPLPHLGLGLALIRRNQLIEGRRQIEIAVGLDPNQSLLRSYLGKAYYEEKRNQPAETQYDIAKTLDPHDPTPWFYSGILKQAENRPVEALQDIQQSIELNDNRAVYRSRQLLDQDEATRSASQGGIYNDLGFQQLGLLEGWKSVNQDPSNSSAHRLLADTYASLPRHQVARVSELSQAQLWQPLSNNPVQPSLAESRIFLPEISSFIPAFNEYYSLFTRDGPSLSLAAIGGGNNTFIDEAVVSGLNGNVAWSLGQFHYETEGFRENQDETYDIYNAFVQVDPAYGTSLQLEYRYKDSEIGDLPLRFDPDNFSRNFQEELLERSFRLGLRHSFSPQSAVLGFLTYNRRVTGQGDFLTADSDLYTIELQYQLQLNDVSVLGGIGHSDRDRETEIRGFRVTDLRTRDTALYAYALWNTPHNVIWTLGASADVFKNGALIDEIDQFNPKFGVIWNPNPALTLRAAAFRTLSRGFLLNNQNLEPTQVAGFNQVFDDAEGTDAWRYGAALDYRFSPTLYGGLEYSYRDLSALGQLPPPELTVIKFDLEEYLGRAYLYATPHPWLAVSADYLYERFERPESFAGPERFIHLESHRLSLGLNFFHPSGLGARLNPVYIVQEGEFQFRSRNSFESGDDQFWVINAGIFYQLPKRWGLLTLEARNLFDEAFQFQDTDPFGSPTIAPERLILGTIVLRF